MSTVRSEFSATVRLALPIALGLAGHGLMTTLDAVILARHSTAALAACGLGANVHMPALLFGYGLVAGVAVLAAQGRGAGDMSRGPRSLRAGLIIAGIFGLLVGAGFHAAIASGLTAYVGLAGPALGELNGFLLALAWSTPFSFLFQVLKNGEEAAERPWQPLAWLAAGLATNGLLAWLLVFGAGPIPALGATGAGLATLAGRVLMFFGLAWGCRTRIRAALTPEAAGGLREMLAFGAPCAVHWAAEVGVFAAAPAVIAKMFGEPALAAHQIAVSVAGLAFMAPLGISMAGGIRVGEAFGAGEPARVRVIGHGALLSAFLFMAIYAVFVAAAHGVIPGWFTGPGGDPETIRIASGMLLVAAFFALGDGLQVTASGLLRGLGDTRFTSAAGIVAYWVIGLPVGLALARYTSLGAVGVWVGLALGLILAAGVFTARWRRMTRP
jgi:MATE family multidrug resistance protein